MVLLNPGQQAAVTAPVAPTLVLAGAGTGKTRVIIERMAWLIEERGVDPRQMLALTFTNRAAGEMRHRLAERLRVERLASWMGTFHSFGLFVLRREVERLDRGKTFTIFDDGDQLSLMKRLVKALPETAQYFTPRETLTHISRYKSRCESAPEPEPGDSEAAALFLLWNQYQDALKRASAYDFDDLLVELVKLFEQHGEVLAKYQRRYPHVLIDEYQDTNHAQYRIARALGAGGGSIFAVGDEDQSIYSWRGADIRNILDFSGDFPEATVHRLEENYRSTSPILDMANRVVANNRERLGKTLYTKLGDGEEVRFELAPSSEEEARWIAAEIAKGIYPANATAILYRTNAQARAIEEALRLRGIHYVVVGGIKFYQRKEVKDIVAYLRLLVNPNDDEAVRRVINVPPRGIGAANLERIEDYARARNQPLLAVLQDIETDTTVSTRARQSAAAFAHIIDEYTLKARDEPVSVLVEELLESLDYYAYVEQSDEKDFRSRIDVVDEFVRGCADHDQRSGTKLAVYLQDLALVTDADSYDPDMPAVTLMTCHTAKGLEFDDVFLAGMEEGVFPLFSDFSDEVNLEEERRLAYVAMTRARKRLTLTAAESRMLYGKTRDDRQVSRFVHEAGLNKPRENPARATMQAAAPVKAAGVAAKPGEYRTGTKVQHAKFGPGTVMYTSGSGASLKARIRFRTGRTVNLMVSKAPLEIVEG
jgi:DNA helicase-2/ATP-dependent DNA helicase PcrA